MAANTEFRVVIPARYASSRFPGKVLATLAGRPMLQHVHERALASRAVEVVIATDDARVAEAAGNFGATVVMTDTTHQSGTDRVAEVARQLGWSGEEQVVNLQGDAPCLPAACIDQVAALLANHPRAGLATLCTPTESLDEYLDPHVVKVVMDSEGRALYFSRSPIPAAGHGHGQMPGPVWRHLGIYAYRVDALQVLTAAQPCYLETSEKLEQLRALCLGMEIRVENARELLGPDVDTPEDLDAAAAFLAARN
ncbi:MAG TPA: 3-deoxy-manno-octulosonate cytidylyltransferase [Chromatiales bacterium]|nr:3-deoxy-manno-octulosonate cytidylyltransferase [Chromatiales bacterium]